MPTRWYTGYDGVEYPEEVVERREQTDPVITVAATSRLLTYFETHDATHAQQRFILNVAEQIARDENVGVIDTAIVDRAIADVMGGDA